MGTSRRARAITASRLKKIYQELFDYFGPQQWWPARTPFEVMVGAILVQNTNWVNAAAAVKNLKNKKWLSAKALHAASARELAAVIRPAGYFNVKVRRLKHFVDFFIREYQGSVRRMAAQESTRVRCQLLSVNGIGPETADSILLYALNKPFFVVDAYTRRILSRHGLIAPKADYDSIQEFFHCRLPFDARLFNEYHALLVRLAKDFCRTKPLCARCPLKLKDFFRLTQHPL